MLVVTLSEAQDALHHAIYYYRNRPVERLGDKDRLDEVRAMRASFTLHCA